jgi:hypothetical protein
LGDFQDPNYSRYIAVINTCAADSRTPKLYKAKNNINEVKNKQLYNSWKHQHSTFNSG